MLKESYLLNELPRTMDASRAYGLWNALSAYSRNGELIDIIPAHDGDFFPESPFDYIEAIRNSISSRFPKDSTYWPIRADIDVTLKCNNNCTFCYTRLYSEHPHYIHAEIAIEMLSELVRDLVDGGTRSIRFTGGGEPFAHKDIAKLLDLPKRNGALFTIFTNGSTLSEETSETLVDNFDHIRVSLNAASDATRKALHRPRGRTNDFRVILKRLAYMAQLRREGLPQAKSPLIWTTFLLSPLNIGEIVAAAHLAKDVGADSISFRPIYRGLRGSFTADQLVQLQLALERAKELDAPGEFRVFVPKRGLDEAWGYNPRGKYPVCFSCHMRAIIEASNNGPLVKVCGMHRGLQGERNDIAGESFGIICDGMRFPEIWLSNEANRSLAGRPSRCGNHCPTTASFNLTMDGIWEILRKHPSASFHRCSVSSSALVALT